MPKSCLPLGTSLRNTLSGSGSCDFVQDRTRDGRIFRTLNIIDEFTKEVLVVRVKRKLNSVQVVDALTDLFIFRGPPSYIRLVRSVMV